MPLLRSGIFTLFALVLALGAYASDTAVPASDDPTSVPPNAGVVVLRLKGTPGTDWFAPRRATFERVSDGAVFVADDIGEPGSKPRVTALLLPSGTYELKKISHPSSPGTTPFKFKDMIFEVFPGAISYIGTWDLHTVVKGSHNYDMDTISILTRDYPRLTGSLPFMLVRPNEAPRPAKLAPTTP